MQPLIDEVLEQVHGAWRFRWIALAVAWGVCAVGWIVVFAMPDVFQASARVFVDTRPLLSQMTISLSPYMRDRVAMTEMNRLNASTVVSWLTMLKPMISRTSEGLTAPRLA